MTRDYADTQHYGLTKKEFFAAHALDGVMRIVAVAFAAGGEVTDGTIAKRAFDIAESMIEESRRRK